MRSRLRFAEDPTELGRVLFARTAADRGAGNALSRGVTSGGGSGAVVTRRALHAAPRRTAHWGSHGALSIHRALDASAVACARRQAELRVALQVTEAGATRAARAYGFRCTRAVRGCTAFDAQSVGAADGPRGIVVAPDDSATSAATVTGVCDRAVGAAIGDDHIVAAAAQAEGDAD